jgi:hypothetical protein
MLHVALSTVCAAMLGVHLADIPAGFLIGAVVSNSLFAIGSKP